ncbi:LpxI family protein [Plastorhodobacter daqingensis]|uniref:LpxI family protein n=1 Tax=Plastorhodobacter daqingensis TaxID=1387281 RepID=A0ABW2UIF6_9RHOB
MAHLAIVAGKGSLPGVLSQALVAQGTTPIIAHLQDFPPEGVDLPLEPFRIERLAPFIARLHDLSVDRVIFAGAVQRPRLDPEQFDPRTAMMVPRMLAAMQQGDDATLREVIAIFEEEGLAVVGADAVLPDLVPQAGVLGVHQPGSRDRADAARAAAVVAALGAADVGQGAVVSGGLCLAAEALPGTDAMLGQVAALGPLRPDRAGLLYKAPKPGQDKRVDLPALGPATVRNAHAAGLAGIAFEAGGVLLLDREAMIAEADRLGLFLWARAAE